jgi:hypothetical protein
MFYYILKNPIQTDWDNCNETPETSNKSYDNVYYTVTPKLGCESYFDDKIQYSVDDLDRVYRHEKFSGYEESDFHSKKLKYDVEFGIKMAQYFVYENKLFDPPMTYEEAQSLINMTLSAKFYAEIGSIEFCISAFQNMTPITRVLEQSRIDFYANTLQEYVDKFYNF